MTESLFAQTVATATGLLMLTAVLQVWRRSTDASTRTPESRTTSSRVPGWLLASSSRSSASRALILALTSVVE